MTSTDPSTSQPLPPDAIQRVLFIAPKVHVYQIPPLTSNKGYTASTWTADDNKRQIFTARLRILETAIPTGPDGKESVKADILLEDPSNGQLFAAAPYKTPAVVEQVLDSARFFAIRVQDEQGRKAVLGIGFEERSESFDFGVSLQEVRKVLGLEPDTAGSGPKASGKTEGKEPEKRDFSLKEGQTITVNIGGKGRRSKPATASASSSSPSTSNTVGNALPVLLPPPPSASNVKAERRRSREPETKSAADLGFDDGEFGEFQ
ncbi:MAG: hypothetical protein M1817_005353 [Caeruleum heppii]|nr:MAG: hypothetical protein M1817_005353 [Caeruleum heppii]